MNSLINTISKEIFSMKCRYEKKGNKLNFISITVPKRYHKQLMVDGVHIKDISDIPIRYVKDYTNDKDSEIIIIETLGVTRYIKNI